MAEPLHNGQWNFNPYHPNFLNYTNIQKPLTQKPSQMFHCIKWQHIFDSNCIVAASNDSTMKQLFMVFHKEHNTHMLCETEKFTNIWLRQPQQDFIMSPNIRIHRHPNCPNSCKIFCQTSSVLICRNCKVYQPMFMMLYAGHFITDNTCNNLITSSS